MTNNNKKAGKIAFFVTLAFLIILIAAYAVSHVVTFRSYSFVHFETDIVTADKQTLLVSIAALGDRLETPMANAAPAIQALFQDLEHSIILAESKDEISALFDTTYQALTDLGVNQDVSPKILAPAKERALEFFSAGDEDKPLPLQLFKAELAIGQAWAREAIGAPSLLKSIEEFQTEMSQAGYSADSKIGKSLLLMTEEIKKDRPNRPLIAQIFSQVADEFHGSKSLFWGHTAMRWLEVIAWSLAGILLIRLWSIGRFIGKDEFEPKWNWWWWAKIIEAPLLAIGVILALSYIELGLVSGETLGVKISLKGQPIEFIVAFSFLLGLFSDSAFGFLADLGKRIFGDSDQN